MANAWAITVAQAAPRTPITGKGPMPRIISGSRMMLITVPKIMTTIGLTASPEPRIRLLMTIASIIRGAP